MQRPETPILLTTINARYRHSAFGLRYLLANLGELAGQARILEFQRTDTPQEMVEILLAHKPRIIAIGVYIWNVDLSSQLVALLKKIAPDVTLVLGGPEVSYETDSQDLAGLADFIICGEGELVFRVLCETIFSGGPIPNKIIRAVAPDLAKLVLPYALYDDQDIAQRVIYVEASRGCPFKCVFCLSALEQTARPFPLKPFLIEMETLLDRGARQFKFVDRTFNLHIETAAAILNFFLERREPGLFLHFEMIPDRLPEQLKKMIAAFPAHMLQFEIGIQTFQPKVQTHIQRRQNAEASEQNMRWLLNETGVHVHAELIIGLPGEDMVSFGQGFDRLLGLGCQEIQVGILKRLRGVPLNALSIPFNMVFNPAPPYDLLYNDCIDFQTLCRLKRFARFWDLIGNSGRFKQVIALIGTNGSPFSHFLTLSDWLYHSAGRTHGIALERLFKLVHQGLLEALKLETAQVTTAILMDYGQGGRGVPGFLQAQPAATARKKQKKPPRQGRHSVGKG